MNSKLQRRLATGTAFAATGILATSIAVAAWNATGTGFGSADALDPENDNMSVVVEFDDDELYPNGAADVTVTLSNPNPYWVGIDSISDDSIAVVAADGSTSLDPIDDCDLTFADQTGPFNVAPGGTPTTVEEFTDALAMGNGSDDVCKGATVTLTLSADGVSITQP